MAPKPIGTVTTKICTHSSLLHPDTNRYEDREVPAYAKTDAIAITPQYGVRDGELTFHDDLFVVTHLASGGAMTPPSKMKLTRLLFDIYAELGDILLEVQPYTDHGDQIRAANQRAREIYATPKEAR